MFTVRDLFGDLPDEWLNDAKAATTWKLRFQCATDLFELCDKLEVDCDIKSTKTASKVIEYLAVWLQTEKHAFTKQKILQILTIIIPRTEPSLWKKHHAKLASATIKQWSEKKLYDLVSPVLTLLWIAQGPLNSWNEALDYAFTSANPVVKSAFWQWIIACSTNDPNKAKSELKAVFEDGKRFEVLLDDCLQKLVELRSIAIKCLACVCILAKPNKANSKLLNAKYESNTKLKKAVSTEQTAIKKLMKENAERLKKLPSSMALGGGDDDESGISGIEDNDRPTSATSKKSKKTPKASGKSGKAGGKSGKGKTKEKESGSNKSKSKSPNKKGTTKTGKKVKQEEEENDGDDDAKSDENMNENSMDGDNMDLKTDNEEDDSEMESEIEDNAPKIPSVEEIYTIKEGGIIEPPIERININYFEAPKLKDGQSLESFIKDNSEKKIGKIASMKAEEVKEAIRDLCSDVEILDLSQKVGVRVEMVEELFANVTKMEDLTDIGPALIFAIQGYMSWDGKDSRNPMLARMSIQMLEWIFLRSKNLKYNLIPVVLPFLINKVPDRKHGESVCKVIWAMCWQYSPSIVLSQIYSLCLQSPSEKHWTPVFQLINSIINTFGVNNCNPIHHLHYTQKLLLTTKQEASKQSCYQIITSIYSQLGKSWEKACLGMLNDRFRENTVKELKLMNDKMKDNVKGIFKQTRVTQGEIPLLPLEYQSQIKEKKAKSEKSSNKKLKTPKSKDGKKSNKRGITPKSSVTTQVGKSGFMTGNTPPSSAKASKKNSGKKSGNNSSKKIKPASARHAINDDNDDVVVTVSSPTFVADPEIANRLAVLENKVQKLEESNEKLLEKIKELESNAGNNKEEKNDSGGNGSSSATTAGASSNAQESGLERFKKWLENTVGLPAYLEKFEKVDCADIRMIEHFDNEFLKDTLGVKNPIHLKMLTKYITQFNSEASHFKQHLLKCEKPKLKHYYLKFEKQGVITWSILSQQCETKNDLKVIFKIENDEHIDALYDLIVKYRNGQIDVK